MALHSRRLAARTAAAALVALCVLAVPAAFAQAPAAPSQTFSATVYFDWTSFLTDAGPRTTVSAPNLKSSFFAFRRAYFTYENKVDDRLRFRFRLDADNTANLTAATLSGTSVATKADDKLRPFVKHLYFQYDDLLPNGTLRVGMEETISFKLAEDKWGYRSVAKTLLDNFKDVTNRDIHQSSADLGISWSQGVSKAVRYQLQVVNGGGYSHVETDRYKKLAAQVQLVPLAGVSLAGYADYERQPAAAGRPKAVTWKLDGYIERVRDLVLGAEWFTYRNDLNLASGSRFDATGWSLFGRYAIAPGRLTLFARRDGYEPNTKAAGDRVSLTILGFDWTPFASPALRLQPNLFLYGYQDGRTYNSAAMKNADVQLNLTFFMSF